jgi:Flp pilus assembly pilin Flp
MMVDAAKTQRLWRPDVGRAGIADMRSLRRRAGKLWADEGGISSVEYAMLLAMVGAGIISAVDLLSGAVSNEMTEAASWFADDDCDNSGGGNGTGGAGGAGQGGDNTC